MFSNAFIALLVGLGAAGWVYGKTMRTTGNNTKSAATAAGVVGFIAFLIILTVASMFNK